MSKLFSIVIPTRNRLETAFHAVRTCLFDPGDDYEVIVFDNASEIAVTHTSLQLDDPRVVIHRSEQTLPMFQSWETALSHAKGDYVIVIGDDDGLLPETLKILRKLILEHPGIPIRWSWVSYNWPSHPNQLKQNSLRIPLSNTGCLLNSEAVIKGIAQMRLQYWALPMLYNSAIPKRVLDRIREKCGHLFLSTCPDVSSGFAAAYEAGTYLFLECPLSIAGVSGKSNGIANISVANAQKNRPPAAQEFVELNRAHGMLFPHPSLPPLMIMPIIVASSFLYVQAKLFPDQPGYQLNLKNLGAACIQDIQGRPAQEAEELLSILKEHVENKADWHHLKPLLAAACATKRAKLPVKLPPRGFVEQDRMLTLDTMKFKIQNVYEASLLTESVLAYKSNGFILKIKTPKEIVLASGRKFLRDVVRLCKLPALLDCD